MSNPIINPYRKVASKAATGIQMGPQSQQRNTLSERTYKLAASAPNSNRKRKKGDQLTLFGGQAFEPDQDCVVCKAKLSGRSVRRSHHPLCYNNSRTKGITSATTLKQQQIDKQQKQHFTASLNESEKYSSRNITKEAATAFFAPTKSLKIAPMTTTTPINSDFGVGDSKIADVFLPEELCRAVTAKTLDIEFRKQISKTKAPVAVVAAAKIVAEEIINKNKYNHQFDGITMTIPASKNMYSSPLLSLNMWAKAPSCRLETTWDRGFLSKLQQQLPKE